MSEATDVPMIGTFNERQDSDSQLLDTIERVLGIVSVEWLGDDSDSDVEAAERACAELRRRLDARSKQ